MDINGRNVGRNLGVGIAILFKHWYRCLYRDVSLLLTTLSTVYGKPIDHNSHSKSWQILYFINLEFNNTQCLINILGLYYRFTPDIERCIACHTNTMSCMVDLFPKTRKAIWSHFNVIY